MARRVVHVFNAMMRVVPILFCVFLAGCYSDQKQQLASCELQATKHTQAIRDLEVQNQESSDFVETCMGAGGYEFDDDYCPIRFQKRALLKRTGTETNQELGEKLARIEQVQKVVAGCYQPMSWFGKKALNLERMLGQASDR